MSKTKSLIVQCEDQQTFSIEQTLRSKRKSYLNTVEVLFQVINWSSVLKKVLVFITVAVEIDRRDYEPVSKRKDYELNITHSSVAGTCKPRVVPSKESSAWRLRR